MKIQIAEQMALLEICSAPIIMLIGCLEHIPAKILEHRRASVLLQMKSSWLKFAAMFARREIALMCCVLKMPIVELMVLLENPIVQEIKLFSCLRNMNA